MRRIAIVKKWIIIIWLIISVAALVLVIHMVLNTMVSYKYEISEKRIIGKLIRGYDSVPIEVAAGYINGEILVLKGAAMYLGINIVFILIMLLVKSNKKKGK
ncbi:unknown [Alistipes sp. CAG:435]|jgi:plastocyanin domain-containing protein|nr:unknown [Alistipes sp. CAG:435]